MEREKGAALRLGSVQKKRWIVRIAVLLAALLLAGTALYVYVIEPSGAGLADPRIDASALNAYLDRLEPAADYQQKDVLYQSGGHRAVLDIRVGPPSERTLVQKYDTFIEHGTIYSHYDFRRLTMEERDAGEFDNGRIDAFVTKWRSVSLPDSANLYEEHKRSFEQEADPDMPNYRNAITLDIRSSTGTYTFFIFSSGKNFLEELVAACVEEANAMIAEQSAP